MLEVIIVPKSVKRRKKGPRLYWALVTPGGQWYYDNYNPARPWLNEVWGTIPPMPPPGYERVQVQLVIRKRGV